MAEFDLVVRGGTLVDGTGGPVRTADVAVTDGRIVDVGRVTGRGRQEIDADGATVTPGLVDVHAHYDGQATWDTRLTPSSWHGVTTVVMGNCGVGFAPVVPAHHDRLIELMEGVEDIPGAALHEGLSWAWRTFGEFLDAVDLHPHDIDVAAQVPHGAVRLEVMGERGAAREPATAEEILRMAELAAEGIRAGALGFSTSRTLNHRTSKGEPTPTLTAEADELVGIAKGVASTGRGVLQVVSDFRDLDEEFAIMERMVRESGRPLSISIAQSPVIPDQWRRLLQRLTEANAAGLPMTGQVATRAIGLLMGLRATLNPFMVNPVLKDLAGLPHAELVRTLQDPAVKEKVLAAQTGERAQRLLGGRLIGKYELMYELDDPPDYEPDPSTNLRDRAARMGIEPDELVYDLLTQDDGETLLYLPVLNYVDGDLGAVREMLTHPHTVPGLGDGGAHVGTICDASFPTTLLAHWSRDRSRGERIDDLAWLVKRHSHDTARLVGFDDRGVVAPGYKADLNVIDMAALQARRPELVDDLPAGGTRVLQRADGYRHTIVSGQETYRDGEATDALPGRLVRGPQVAPA